MDAEKVGKWLGGIFIAGICSTSAAAILKLCKVVDWEWHWILSPIWIPSVVLFFTIIVLIVWAVTRALINRNKVRK